MEAMAQEATPSAASPITESRIKRVPPGSAGRVLVVDDAQCLCEGLRRSLRTSGYEVVGANDGGQALALATTVHFDVVLTDLRMPFMAGDELIASLAASQPNLPCILMSGQATRDDVVRVVRHPNVVGILVKPLDHARLLALLAQAVQRSRGANPAPNQPAMNATAPAAQATPETHEEAR